MNLEDILNEDANRQQQKIQQKREEMSHQKLADIKVSNRTKEELSHCFDNTIRPVLREYADIMNAKGHSATWIKVFNNEHYRNLANQYGAEIFREETVVFTIRNSSIQFTFFGSLDNKIGIEVSSSGGIVTDQKENEIKSFNEHSVKLYVSTKVEEFVKKI